MTMPTVLIDGVGVAPEGLAEAILCRKDVKETIANYKRLAQSALTVAIVPVSLARKLAELSGEDVSDWVKVAEPVVAGPEDCRPGEGDYCEPTFKGKRVAQWKMDAYGHQHHRGRRGRK
jgi:hypothetical protein